MNATWSLSTCFCLFHTFEGENMEDMEVCDKSPWCLWVPCCVFLNLTNGDHWVKDVFTFALTFEELDPTILPQSCVGVLPTDMTWQLHRSWKLQFWTLWLKCCGTDGLYSSCHCVSSQRWSTNCPYSFATRHNGSGFSADLGMIEEMFLNACGCK